MGLIPSHTPNSLRDTLWSISRKWTVTVVHTKRSRSERILAGQPQDKRVSLHLKTQEQTARRECSSPLLESVKSASKVGRRPSILDPILL